MRVKLARVVRQLVVPQIPVPRYIGRLVAVYNASPEPRARGGCQIEL